MPEEYRKQLIRMMSQHAHSEIIGMYPEGNWITRAPSLKRKIALLAKVQDECGHGMYLYSAAETLGISREEMEEALLIGKAKYASVFNYPALTWGDMGAIGWLVDGAAIINQTMLAKCSYGPYALAMTRICKEENFHQKQGQDIFFTLARGSKKQRKMIQDALNRWWWPALMMFGPHDTNSPNSSQLMKWRVKLKSNDELRQKFLNLMVPQIHGLELKIPDDKLYFDEESKNWVHGPINWEEFYTVVKGRGPLNKERLNMRKKAKINGQWVINAAKKYHERFGHGK